jgi:6-pyruvoyltetrahydropterin/6-carboxytetrahydropterin synthase
MTTVTKLFEFEAAHHLPNHPGKCKSLHGHTYKLEVEVGYIYDQVSEKTPEQLASGMVIDFGDLKAMVNDIIISKFDHQYLNNLFVVPPTAENMVEWIAGEIQVNLFFRSHKNTELVRVRLWETSTRYAEWRCS